jgi:hypothetical protein
MKMESKQIGITDETLVHIPYLQLEKGDWLPYGISG